MTQGRKENEEKSERIEKAKEYFKGATMKIRMKVSIASSNPEFSYQPTQVVVVDRKLALAWISGELAEEVGKDEPVTEAATLETNEFMSHDPRILRRMRGAA
jgi:hypothetical protein